MFGRRSDGTLVRGLSTMRAFMPFISPRRNDALVYFDMEIEVDAAESFVDQQNERRPEDRQMTLFHLYLRSMALAYGVRPHLNRFTAGGRLWQRDGIYLTFSAKKELVDGSPITTVKRRFDQDQSLDEMVDGILDSLKGRRTGKKTQSDKEMSLGLSVPPFLTRAVVQLLKLANYLGLLPRKMIDDDPLFTSTFVANLGSLGMDPGYHHLWEYGTCPAFAMVGKIYERPDGKRAFNVRYSYDERIEDGLYAGITMGVIKEGVENPEKLL